MYRDPSMVGSSRHSSGAASASCCSCRSQVFLTICLVYLSRSSIKTTFINNYNGKNSHVYYSAFREKRLMDLANREAMSINVTCCTRLVPRSSTIQPIVPCLIRLKYDTILFCGLGFVPLVSPTPEKAGSAKNAGA